MSLTQWRSNGWLREHRTSPREIANLLAIVDRDLVDAAAPELSADWQFGIAYNAALKLSTILLYIEGFRPENTLAHYRTIEALQFTMAGKHAADAAYLQACRSKRNMVEYDNIGGASFAEAAELLEFSRELRTEVIAWLRRHHPALCAEL